MPIRGCQLFLLGGLAALLAVIAFAAGASYWGGGFAAVTTVYKNVAITPPTLSLGTGSFTISQAGLKAGDGCLVLRTGGNALTSYVAPAGVSESDGTLKVNTNNTSLANVSIGAVIVLLICFTPS